MTKKISRGAQVYKEITGRGSIWDSKPPMNGHPVIFDNKPRFRIDKFAYPSQTIED